MSRLLTSELTYRIVDQNTGVEVVNPLPHPHMSSWTVMALQPGIPGGGTIGTFRLPLFPPRTKEYRAYKTLYDKLAPGQRVEAYVGRHAQGTPRFSGFLDNSGFTRSLTGFAVGGMDTLGWLQRSLVLPGEQFPATFVGTDILHALTSTFEVVMADDFTAASPLSVYTQTPTGQWSATTDPYLNHAAIQCSTVPPAARSFLTASTIGTVAQWQQCRVSAIGTIVAGTDTANSGELAVVVQSDSTGANCGFGRAVMRATAGTQAVDAEIWTNTGGTLARQALVSNVFTGLTSAVFRCQVEMVGVVASNGHQFWRLLINGKDSGCTWDQGGVAQANRTVGITFLPAAAGGPTVYVDDLVWEYRNITAPRFQAGTIGTSTRSLGQLVSGQSQSQLDLIGLAMTLDSWYVRKNPGRGFKADTYDFSASPGRDLSGVVRFEEGHNLENLETVPASDLYATSVRMTSTPGGDSGGAITWPRTGASGDMVLTDAVTDTGIGGFTLLVHAARALQAVKAAPWSGKIATVLRDAQTADAWRELDFITLHAPSVSIVNLKALVLGYTYTEMSVKQAVYLDQYSELVSEVVSARHNRALEAIGNTYATR